MEMGEIDMQGNVTPNDGVRLIVSDDGEIREPTGYVDPEFILNWLAE